MAKKETPEETGPIGGIVYLISLLVWTFLALSLVATSPWITPHISGTRAALLIGGVGLGGWIAHRIIRAELSVFLHELKHSILSNLSGNKDKGMTVKRNSGEFRYAYSKATAHMNAFISLAPYCLPLASIVGIPLTLALVGLSSPLGALAVGICAGIDLVLNLRDISWYQTDLTEVIGGYPVSLWYIGTWNCALWSVLLGFGLAGMPGVLVYARGLWQIIATLLGVEAPNF